MKTRILALLCFFAITATSLTAEVYVRFNGHFEYYHPRVRVVIHEYYHSHRCPEYHHPVIIEYRYWEGSCWRIERYEGYRDQYGILHRIRRY